MTGRRPEDLDELLRGARADTVTPEEQRALLGALASRLGGTPPPGGGGATPFHTGRVAGVSRRPRIGIAAAVGGVAIVTWWVMIRAPGSASPQGTAAPVVAHSSPAGSPAPPELPATAPRPAPNATAPEAEPSASGIRAAPFAPRRTTSHEAPSEASLIERARNALKTTPSRALLLTDEHRRIWPDGQLASEREVIAIDALVRLGRRSDAVARAETFRAQHPSSIYSSRIAALLAPPPRIGSP